MNDRATAVFASFDFVGRRRRGQKGFSLIELGVSIVVVAVLVLVVALSVGAAQKRARAMDCHSKLRAIGVGLSGYLQDKGYYPGLRIDATPRFWHHALVPYMTGEPMPVKSADVSIVPNWMWCKERDIGRSQSFGYGYNQYFGNIPPGSTDSNPDSPFNAYWHLKPAMVAAPSEKVVIGDNHDASTATVFSNRALHNGSAEENTHRARRHLNGGNYLFADGHVEAVSAVEMGRRLGKDDKRIFKPYAE